MRLSEIRSILRELVSFCAKNEWGQMTLGMAYPIHGKLSSALSDPRTRREVREVLSEELAEAPSEVLAYYAAIHAVEDRDMDTIRELANRPEDAVRAGAGDGLIPKDVGQVPFVLEAMRDVSARVRELACEAFHSWIVTTRCRSATEGEDAAELVHAREMPLPFELFAAALADHDAGVRRAAVGLVGTLLEDVRLEPAPFLMRFVELLDGDENAEVQNAVAVAIRTGAKGGVDVQACLPALRRHAESPNSPAARIARSVLACIASGKYPLVRRR